MIEFTDISKILTGKAKKTVHVHGWLHHKRSSGGVQFLLIRDGTGIIQSTLRKGKIDKKTFDKIDRSLIESAVEIKGTVKKDKPGSLSE